MLLRAWEQSADGHSSLTVHSTSTRTSVHPPLPERQGSVGESTAPASQDVFIERGGTQAPRIVQKKESTFVRLRPDGSS